jgi:predicted transcriptional regulator
MLPNDIVIDMLEVVLRRFSFFDSLGKDPKDKRTLVDELDCSRSTVNRGIRELEGLDLVAYTDGGYRITPLGATVATGFAELAETVELRLRYKPFLEWMPEDAFDLDLTLLRDAELLVPEAGDPYAMVNRHVNVLSQAEDLKAVLPLVGVHAYEAVHKQIVDNGARCEGVVTPEVADTLQSNPNYAEITKELAATGRFQLYQYDGDIPYFVGLLDDTVQMGVDEEGEPRAIVETTNPEVQNWAETTFTEYKQQAEQVVGAPEKTRVRS